MGDDTLCRVAIVMHLGFLAWALGTRNWIGATVNLVVAALWIFFYERRP